MYRRFVPPITGLTVFVLLHISGVFSHLLNSSMDLLFYLRGGVEPSQSLILIGVDDRSQDRLGSWPFPRDIHAALLKQLSKAKVIGFDFIFTTETELDSHFSRAMEKGATIVLGVAHGARNELLLPAATLSGYSATGHIETLRSGDGIVRKVQLFRGENLPSFALALYRAAGFILEKSPSEPCLINYLGPEKTFLTLSYLDVITGLYDTEFFSDAIVLVGADDKTLGDSHSTPFSQRSLSSGVEIQANILHNLLTDSFLKIKSSITWIVLLLLFIGALVVWPVHAESFNFFVNILVLFSLTTAAIIFFRYGVVLDVVRPVIFLFITYLFHLLAQIFWMAGKLITYFNTIEAKIKSNLGRLFHSIPEHLGLQKKRSAHKLFPDLQHRLLQIESSARAIDMQNDFIENILSVAFPPLVLWDRKTKKALLTNRAFDILWENSLKNLSSPPNLSKFIGMVNRRSQPGTGFDEKLILSQSFEEVNTDIIFPDRKGVKKYYRVFLRRFSLNNGLFEGVLAGMTDVTEIKELERIKDEMVSIVSHELKLPLTTILGYGEMLETGLKGKQREYAETICKQSVRLSDLITDFLDISRLESWRTLLNIYPFDLKYVVEESISSITIAAEKKQIIINANLPTKVSPLMGDEQLLLQALVNILENSIKYSPTNTCVRVELMEKQDRFELEVTDQGPGIPVSEQETIFNKFIRRDKHAKEAGFGLGLSLVKRVVALHDGRVGVVNSEKPGTTILLTLPKKMVS